MWSVVEAAMVQDPACCDARFRPRPKSGCMLPSIQGGEMVRVVVRARALRTMSQPIVGFMCKDRLGQFLFGDNTWERYGEGFPVGCGQVLEAVFAFLKLRCCNTG